MHTIARRYGSAVHIWCRFGIHPGDVNTIAVRFGVHSLT